ncbi:MAG: WXG100 family type VII secretion target [Anaerolineaceae bacterium]|nr:WXG100 family type VII secretion target [Anaerolineaceae bacterium]
MAFYDYDGMRTAGSQVQNEATNLQTLIDTVSKLVANLGNSWSDVAQTKFESQWNEMVPKFRAFVPELEAYSKAIMSHANKMEEEGQTI